MKKILYPFVGDSVGGSHVSTVITIKNLDVRKFKYEVVLEKAGPLEKFLKINNIDYFILNQKKTGFIFSFLKRFFVLTESKPDIVHTNDLRMHHRWTILCFIKKIPHLWHQHTLYYSRINRFYLLFATRVITISNFCLKSFSKTLKKKTEIILNPFESNKFKNISNSYKNTLRKKLGFQRNDKILMYVGDDNEQKRFRFFISLAKKVSIDIKNVKFLIFVKKLKNKKIKIKNFYFFEGNHKLEDYFKISDILICPAINEGFGRVLVEANFFKTLVIASDSGGHSEIIKNGFNGFLIPKDSTKLFLKKIIDSLKVFDDKEINKILENAFKLSIKKYSLENYKRKLFSIYDKF